ncbi:MAG: type I restriction-modification system subunit M [Tenuifilaceae bacterium]|jgi:type I restriction enzyme M protein|nr:type I restriction-modification system subunit M [Bacteroidales bacterium]MDI9515580.1 type I restriction-modification system subunit M [Bacteroidota bacterium]NLH55777.1 type I restriction-modification system subunit M [Rikenellaceae bacterium]OQC64139.1 MAG: Type I restriction enzyme EcoKI M protein [Bacteroidetes bacterium ADurb.Bin008]HNV81386.1 type I restriction-modification system subunit M [Tenuifilaceae bacterium]
MAIKKSELYSSLWASCDELRGSMDASQYKDYVLVLLFMKYVSDKKDPLVELKEGTTFYDMLKHRGKSDIGDQINKIIGEFAKNNNLTGIITEADFNDDAKLGTGKDKVDRLTNLLNIFNNEELNFSGNRADGDDLLGDAYEYLMKNFATESGKSKGQFYTPSEVSRIMAQVIGINRSKSQDETIYDPTCGSGSLLLKAADVAPHGITIYGQENDNATRALAVMNMWLHNFADAEIKQGNTLSSPEFLNDETGELKQFDYAVANPPFSYKAWMNGIDPEHDIYKRFEGYDAIPPKKNGDFAFLLHLIKSLKSKGKACIVLPLGVLFRGNAEAEIRKQIIKKGYIKAIIGLPPNLFYGTGIAASLLVLDKEDADKRTHIFMIDASKGFKKDGNKNRLREQDIHKIVDTFNTLNESDPKYARLVPISEIADPKNDYNLNIPRYIDSQEAEDIQDIEAHLLGGIPKRDIEALENYWKVYPTLKAGLFKAIDKRPDFYELIIAGEEIKNTIFNHPEFTAFGKQMEQVFSTWKTETIAYTKALDKGLRPKHEIHIISENLLKHYTPRVQTQYFASLYDKYAMYQHLMDYWSPDGNDEAMQDDFYEIAAEGWAAGNEVKRKEKKTKKGDKEIVKEVAGIEGLEGRLIPPALMIQEYFATEQKAIEELEAKAETLNANMEEMREEHGGEEGLLSNTIDDKGKISKANLGKAIKELGKRNEENAEEFDMLAAYKKLMDEEADTQTKIKAAKAELEKKVIAQYPKLTIDEIKTIVVEKKWMTNIEQRIRTEMDNISHRLTQRIKELAERYENPMPKLTNEVAALTSKVEAHLQAMGFDINPKIN